MPDCIDLRERFGDEYFINWDECRIKGGRPAPWLMQIRCKYGHIFPHGGDELAVSVDGHPSIAGRIRRLKCCRVHQGGSDGVTAIFHMHDFAQVAVVIRPRRRPRLTDEQRAARAARMKDLQQSRQQTQ